MPAAEGATALSLLTLIVRDYDRAIAFFVNGLGFDLVHDVPATTNDGRPKRWVVVRPPGAETGLLLARADGARQQAITGDQCAGRVGFFLRVANVAAAQARLEAAGGRVVQPRRREAHGDVVVFADCEGNHWDRLGPSPSEMETAGDSPIAGAGPGEP